MSDQNWRTDIDAADYFLHQKKKMAVADRRPVIRRASDLVGPGIAEGAVRLGDFNDPLATFNGFYSAVPGALNAPDAQMPLHEREDFIGQVVSDSALGGRQVFTGLATGIEFSRTFRRSPTDPSAIAWGAWGGQRIPATAQGYYVHLTAVTYPARQTLLTPPDLTTIGDPGVYERSDAGIRIMRQGVYTGTIQVGCSNMAAVSEVTIRRPDGYSTTMITHLEQRLGPTAYYPFTIWASDGEQGFLIYAMHGMEMGNHRFWWRFTCTRVGDAV